MKRMATIVAAAFALGLAVVIGTRMSAEAMAVVVGVTCGVMASVPTCPMHQSLHQLSKQSPRTGAGMVESTIHTIAPDWG